MWEMLLYRVLGYGFAWTAQTALAFELPLVLGDLRWLQLKVWFIREFVGLRVPAVCLELDSIRTLRSC